MLLSVATSETRFRKAPGLAGCAPGELPSSDAADLAGWRSLFALPVSRVKGQPAQFVRLYGEKLADGQAAIRGELQKVNMKSMTQSN